VRFASLAIALVGLSPAAFGQGFVDHADLDPILEPAPNSMGGGVAFIDYDGDGFQDLLVAHGHHGAFLYRNGGPGDFEFSEVTLAEGLPPAMTAAVGVGSADLDRDGDPEIVVSDYGKTWMFEYTGGRYKDVTASALPGLPWYPAMATFADVDGDGWTDVYVAGYTLYVDWPYHDCAPDMLLRNRGDGTFEDIAAASGADDTGCTLTALFSDYDRDGDPDILTANDFGTFISPNRLYRNDGLDPDGDVVFTDVTVPSNAGSRLYGMGLTTADIDGNRYPDYFGTSIGRSVLLIGQPDGWFDDVTEVYGVESALGYSDWRATWGCAFLDVENDGQMDLHVASGYLSAAFEIRSGLDQPSLLFEDLSAARRADDRAIEWDVAPPDQNHGVAVGDFDSDGDEDILTAAIGGQVHLYRNEADAQPSVRVTLHGTVSNTDGLGAWVGIRCAGGFREKELTTGGSFGSAHASTMVIPALGCDDGGTVEVAWPSGHIDIRPIAGGGLDLDLTEADWFTATPDHLPADGVSTATIRVTPNDFRGELVGDGAAVELTTTAGTLSSVTDLGDGTYEATLTAPATLVDMALSLRVDGRPFPAHPRVRTYAAGGDRTTLYASPSFYIADETQSQITVVPRDSDGTPDGAGHTVSFDLVRATAFGGVVDHGDGRYSMRVRGDGGGPMQATARVDGTPRGETLEVPEIAQVDPDASVVRLLPGWSPSSVLEEDLEDEFADTLVSILVSPRDGMGNTSPTAHTWDYVIRAAGGEVPFDRIPRSGSVTLRMPARRLAEAGPVTIEADGVELSRIAELFTYDDQAELAAAVDPSQSRMGPYLESAYADGQDYTWIEVQLRDEDGDAVPITDRFSYESDLMTLLSSSTHERGEEGKARLRAGLVPGRAIVEVTFDGEPTGVTTWLDLVGAKTRDLENDRLRICLADSVHEANGIGGIGIEIVAMDDQDFLLGSNYPLVLSIDDVEAPLDYGRPGAYLADVEVPLEPAVLTIETCLAGTDRGATLTLEFHQADVEPIDPDRPYCADLERGVCPPALDAGPDGGDPGDAGREDDAGPSDGGPSDARPGDFRAGGGGCACGVTPGANASAFAVLVALLGVRRRR